MKSYHIYEEHVQWRLIHSFWTETTNENRIHCLHTDVKAKQCHHTSQSREQRYYSQQTKPVLSACLYQLDAAQLRTEDSINHNQEEKETCAYGVREHLVLWVYTVCVHLKKNTPFTDSTPTYTLTPTHTVIIRQYLCICVWIIWNIGRWVDVDIPVTVRMVRLWCRPARFSAVQ